MNPDQQDKDIGKQLAGKLLKNLCTELSISKSAFQSAFAVALGKSEETVGRYMRGKIPQAYFQNDGPEEFLFAIKQSVKKCAKESVFGTESDILSHWERIEDDFSKQFKLTVFCIKKAEQDRVRVELEQFGESLGIEI